MTRRSMETWGIRDAIRDSLSTRTPRTGPDLFDLVTDEWGHVDERRLWRALGWLVHRGIAVRVNRPRVTSAYVERGYVRGTGIEYPCDVAARKIDAEIASGRCTACKEDRGIRPRWMRSALCWDCYRAEQNEQRQTQRIVAGLCVREAA